MTTYLAFDNLPFNRLPDFTPFTLEGKSEPNPDVIWKDYEEIVPLTDEDNVHLLRILEAKFGKFEQEDDTRLPLKNLDHIVVFSFFGIIPKAKHSYTEKEVMNCYVDFTHFIFEEG